MSLTQILLSLILLAIVIAFNLWYWVIGFIVFVIVGNIYTTYRDSKGENFESFE